MAILNKDLLDKQKANDERIAKEKRDALVNTFNEMRTKLMELTPELIDIIDTNIYLKQIGLGYKTKSLSRGTCLDRYYQVLFNGYSNNETIAYLNYLDYQQVAFTNGVFFERCVHVFNGKSDDLPIADIEPTSMCNYFLEQCNNTMRGFIEEYPDFKSQFMDAIK